MAEFLDDDRQWLLNNKPDNEPLTQMEIALLESTFDSQTTYDIENITKNMKETSLLKKVCFIKLLTFPLEYFLATLLLKKDYKNHKLRLAKLYFRFLRNKIKLENFKKVLQDLNKSSII